MTLNRLRRIRQAILVLAISAACLESAATRTVTSFGAIGNGVADDTARLQTAIDRTPVGGTLIFPAGRYRITRPLELRSGRTYQGEDGAQLMGEGGNFNATTEYDNTHDLIIENLIFVAGGLSLNGQRVPATNVIISHCTFENILTDNKNWTTHNAIFSPSGLRNSKIVANRFIHILEGGEAKLGDSDAGGIAGWGMDHVEVSDNRFDTVNQGVHVFFNQPWPSSHVVFRRNVGVRIHRMGIELQAGNTVGLLVEENRFSDFLNPYWNTFGLSIAADGNLDGIVRNNTIIGLPAPQTGVKYGIGIEIGGVHTLVTGNRVEGLFVMGVGLGTAPRALVENNYACGSPGAMKIEAYLRPQPGTVFQNNFQNVDCRALEATWKQELTSRASSRIPN
jgi:Pectate lyase superfamily protein